MTTYITFVLDETGSMRAIKDETISGFNKYLETLKEGLKGRTSFSLLKFDSEKKDWFVKNKSVKKVEELNEDTFVPGALTPLWDAVAYAIQEMDKRLKGKKNPDIVFTVLTDGYENASREFTAEQVKEMIEERDTWAFNFVGAGIDAWTMSDQMGMARGSAISPDREAIFDTMNLIGGQTVSYASGSVAQKTAMRSSFYDSDEE